MNSINWTQYGLKKNPYDTGPLVEGGDISIDKAFVGRVHERNVMDSIITSFEQACIVIEGNVGVGKTSLAAFEKVAWKNESKNKKLFSFRGEIEANEQLLNKDIFLLEIMSGVLREIELLDKSLLQKDDFLAELNRIVNISLVSSSTWSGTIASNIPFINGEVTSEQTIAKSSPIRITTTFLESSFEKLLQFIRTHSIRNIRYEGLIVHMNNFDVLLQEHSNKKKVIRFFQEMRDIFQTRYCVFLFLGPPGFYKNIIVPHARVRAIFSPPLILKPLSKQELVWAIQERMMLLKSDGISHIIEPVSTDTIHQLYDLFAGDIRAVFRALSDILSQSGSAVSTKSVEESMMLLAQERFEKIRPSLTEEQIQVLLAILTFDQPFTQTELTALMGKAQTNISGYYFSALKNAGIVENIEVKGRFKFWQLTKEYKPLQYIKTLQKKASAHRAIPSQMELF